jgi:hypothetical protein
MSQGAWPTRPQTQGNGLSLVISLIGVGISAFPNQSDIAGYVNVSGAVEYAGTRFEVDGAAVVFDMGYVIVPESLQALQNEPRRFETNCAVGGIGDDQSGSFEYQKIVFAALAREYFVCDCHERIQSDSAGNAFSAALRKAQL